MSQKLGHQIQTWTPDAIATVYRAPGHVLKLIGTAALDWTMIFWWRAQRPDGILIYRPFWAYQTLADPREQARWGLGQVGPYRNIIDYFEGPNEEWANAKWLPRYGDFSWEYGDELHRHGAKYLSGSFPRGGPRLEDLHLYRRGLEKSDAIGTHEYGYPDRVGDLSRYRQVLTTLDGLGFPRLPIIVSEMGTVDDNNAGGWRKYESADRMAARMRAYAQEVAQEPRILGVATFVTGTWAQQSDGSPGRFVSFELAGVRAFEDVVNEDIPTSGGNGGGNTVSAYSVGPGVLGRMALLNDTPASDEVWTGDKWSTTFGESGRQYVWLPSLNQVFVFQPDQG